MNYWTFIAVTIVAASLLERRYAHHRRRDGYPRRVGANVTIFVIALLFAKALASAAAPLQLWWASAFGSGLVGLMPRDEVLVWAVAFVAYDLQRYLIHRVLHLPGVWRVHMLHHSDADLDWSTTSRHHPFEMIPVLLLSAIAVGALGINPLAIAAIGFVRFGWDTFTHANIALPPRFERVLGWVFITPSIHRLHHSADRQDANSNFGAVFSIWDRMFGTLRAGTPVRFGLEELEPSAHGDLVAMLLLPFRYPRVSAGSDCPDGSARVPR